MLETLYLSMDANFKLKQKDRGFTDPPLANGYAYMVSNEKLLNHLADCADKKDLKDDVCLSLNSFYQLLTELFRLSHVARTSTQSMTPIQSAQLAML